MLTNINPWPTSRMALAFVSIPSLRLLKGKMLNVCTYLVRSKLERMYTQLISHHSLRKNSRLSPSTVVLWLEISSEQQTRLVEEDLFPFTLTLHNILPRYISASVTDDVEINQVMEFIVKDSGTDSMDVCVCAAGVLGTYDALDYPVEDFKRVSSSWSCVNFIASSLF